ncbi:YheC/YheD family protein [Bacillus kexueae]|uniref:YheC/YheD family endospore coat-associated protein n=1 Tax=Aeribacillus kexueae TaxID=2078952 RepID=UPI001FAFE999|nr:YheC/YheD family protein [Bacillus kexueae]
MNQMPTIGFLVTNEKHEQAYLSGVAQAAKQYGFTCIRFLPEGYMDDYVSGERYLPTHKMWEKTTLPLPDIIYDRCHYAKPNSKQKQRVQQLKQATNIPFLQYGLPNKWTIYERLQTSGVKRYLPTTEFVDDVNLVFSFLQKWKKIIVKPVFGSTGRGIMTFKSSSSERYVLQYVTKSNETKEKIVTKPIATTLLKALLKKSPYLIQPLLSLRTEDHRPFDLRLLLQKDRNGQWTIRSKAIRLGQQFAYVSNIAKGGRFLPFNERTLTWDPSEQVDDLLQKLLPAMETRFHTLFELGIDVGVDLQNKRIWLLDVNSKPGYKIIFHLAPERAEDLYKAPLLYGLYVLEQEVNRYESQHPPC